MHGSECFLTQRLVKILTKCTLSPITYSQPSHQGIGEFPEGYSALIIYLGMT
jgi:hypothetical protein